MSLLKIKNYGSNSEIFIDGIRYIDLLYFGELNFSTDEELKDYIRDFIVSGLNDDEFKIIKKYIKNDDIENAVMDVYCANSWRVGLYSEKED